MTKFSSSNRVQYVTTKPRREGALTPRQGTVLRYEVDACGPAVVVSWDETPEFYPVTDHVAEEDLEAV